MQPLLERHVKLTLCTRSNGENQGNDCRTIGNHVFWTNVNFAGVTDDIWIQDQAALIFSCSPQPWTCTSSRFGTDVKYLFLVIKVKTGLCHLPAKFLSSIWNTCCLRCCHLTKLPLLSSRPQWDGDHRSGEREDIEAGVHRLRCSYLWWSQHLHLRLCQDHWWGWDNLDEQQLRLLLKGSI